jgi:hypothetical protein
MVAMVEAARDDRDHIGLYFADQPILLGYPS